MSLPVLLTAVCSGREAVTLEKETDPEMLLPSMVYREIPREAHRELLRAQAILVRSRVCRSLKEPEALADLLRENVEYEQQVLMDESLLRRCREAVSDTQGQVLISGGTLVEGSWFVCGNGKTRNGAEAAGQEECGWMVSVDSPADVESPGEVFQQIFPGGTDSAGYVTEVSVGTARLSGENFRKRLGLPSSCFTMQEGEDGLHFLCQGKGHGLGMSQYGAERMAQEGKTAEEILKYYFPNAQVGTV